MEYFAHCILAIGFGMLLMLVILNFDDWYKDRRKKRLMKEDREREVLDRLNYLELMVKTIKGKIYQNDLLNIY